MGERPADPDQIARAITRALNDGNLEAVPGLIARLAGEDRARAESVSRALLAVLDAGGGTDA